MVLYFPYMGCTYPPLQSIDESQIPDSLLERLVSGAREFPPVCAIVGGILGQVIIEFSRKLFMILI